MTLIFNKDITQFKELFSDDTLTFIEKLLSKFQPKIHALLEKRKSINETIQNTCLKKQNPFTFINEDIVPQSDWKGPTIHPTLKTRHVEITGPANHSRMVWNSFNCGADVYMSDFEDSLSPTLNNILSGQQNLFNAIRDKLLKDGKKLPPNETTLVVRTRGLHLIDYNIMYNKKPIYGCLFDFGCYFYLNAKTLLTQKKAPLFYIPKLENYEEAQLWAEIYEFAEQYIGIEKGTIRATVLIETLPAVFQMDAIIYALKDYCAGLNCGRWDYIFSYIKQFIHSKDHILPDRNLVNMNVDFMNYYSLELVKTCHKRGIHAMGGMSANVPYRISTNHSAAEKEKLRGLNHEIIEKIKADKTSEANNGHDGAWAAHPEIVPIVKEIFLKKLAGQPNQINFIPNKNTLITANNLTDVPIDIKKEGLITEDGVRTNISIGLQYIIAWLNGVGAVGIGYSYNQRNNHPPRLMEDLATAEISRSQLYQWIKHNSIIIMADKTKTQIKHIIDRLINEEIQRLKSNQESVFYDRTPEINKLETQLSIVVNQEEISQIKEEINQRKQHCINSFNKGCGVFKTSLNKETLDEFITLELCKLI